jgi:hypothetical protein
VDVEHELGNRFLVVVDNKFGEWDPSVAMPFRGYEETTYLFEILVVDHFDKFLFGKFAKRVEVRTWVVVRLRCFVPRHANFTVSPRMV